MVDVNAPSTTVAPGEANSGLWSRVLGCLLTTLVSAVFLAGFGTTLWGCVEGSPASQGVIRPVVVDEARLLSAAAIHAIEQVRFPSDIPVLVRITDAPVASIAGPAATDRMEHETHWQKVQPRTWHQRYVKQNAPWGSGMYLLVSARPALVQVRFGDRIRLDAYRAGLAAGPHYRRMQEAFAANPGEAEIVAIVRDAAARLPGVLNTPWYLSLVRSMSSVAFSEIEEFVLPADGAFRKWVVRTYVGILRELGAAATGWRYLLFTALCYCVLWPATYFLSRAMRQQSKAAQIVAGTASLLAKGIYFVAALASLLLLANGRIEDELLLRDLGLQPLKWTGFDSQYFAVHGGWILAIVTGIAAFIASALESMEEMQEAKARGETQVSLNFLFAPFAWGALVLFLPRGIGLFALLNRVASGIGSFVRIGLGAT
jgi:hypothetical protein